MPAETITSTIDVDRSPADVYALLDDLAAHESFTDHYITHWKVSGPARGVGGTAKVKVKGGKSEITVVESTPERIVEHGRGGPAGRWATTGTYELEPKGDAATHVTFRNTIDAPSGVERFIAARVLRTLQRDNDKALERLRQKLVDRPAV
jgi:hypothetical protein